MKPIPQRMLPPALIARRIASLAACGGSGDDAAARRLRSSSPPRHRDRQRRRPRRRAARAKVCLDLNDNRACDAAEPSATSAADGSYTLTARRDRRCRRTRVLAEATADDRPATPTTAPSRTAFTLGAPAGKSAVISPFTTLVLSAVDSGRAPTSRRPRPTCSTRWSASRATSAA